ncbi:MAG: hypothetical protein ABI268_05760 [Rhodanobacter sp.]
MSRQGSTGSWVAAVVMALAVVGAGGFLANKAMHGDRPAAITPTTSTPASMSTADTPFLHPITQAQAVPASASTAALPVLDQSDDDVASSHEGLLGNGQLSALLLRPQIIERIVASIDAMPDRSLGGFMLPAKTSKGTFVTQEIDGNTVIGAENAAR